MNSFHKNFQLNERSFTSVEELLKYAASFSDSVYKFLKDWFSSDETLVVKTSGSTGKPKPIALKKEFMINSAKATGSYFKLDKDTTALLCLSTDYIAGKMMLVRALTLGWQLDVVAPESNPIQKLDKVYDFSAMVPLQLQNAIANLRQIKKLIVGGGAVSASLYEQIQDTETEIFATYGMTETITHIAIKKLNNFSSNRSEIEKTFYHILPNVTIYKDERNCLLLKAPKVTDEFIITNDVVELVSDKAFIWLGRFDNVINSGGIKLHPEVIEEKLADTIKERFFVTGIKDVLLGEKSVLIVEGKHQEINFSKLRSLSKYEIPKAVYFVEKFIETETKKIQRLKTLDLLKL